MLNYIWFGIMFIAVIVGIFTGNIDAVTEAAISMSKTAVEIAIGEERTKKKCFVARRFGGERNCQVCYM